MRPEREDIAAPEIPGGLEWVGEAPHSMAALLADGPVLVHFFDFAQLNSVRALPYLAAWAGRYRDSGLTVIGVQAPRFPFGSDPATVSAGLKPLGVEHPVAIDSRRDLWRAYGCEGWPSLFLWGGSGALRWFHFGEGDYLGTEQAIQEELREVDALRTLPEPLEPLRESDRPGAMVMPPSEEIFPGGSWERPWVAGEDGEQLEVEYQAGGAHATIEGRGVLEVELDGRPLDPVQAEAPGLHTLVEHDRHEGHRLLLRPSPGMRVWSLSFSAGVP